MYALICAASLFEGIGIQRHCCGQLRFKPAIGFWEPVRQDIQRAEYCQLSVNSCLHFLSLNTSPVYELIPYILVFRPSGLFCRRDNQTFRLEVSRSFVENSCYHYLLTSSDFSLYISISWGIDHYSRIRWRLGIRPNHLHSSLGRERFQNSMEGCETHVSDGSSSTNCEACWS